MFKCGSAPQKPMALEEMPQFTLFAHDEELPQSLHADTDVGIDDMNMAELLLGFPNARHSRRDGAISTPWEKGSRKHDVKLSSTKCEMHWTHSRTGKRRYLIHQAPASEGLPSPDAEDVMLALMQHAFKKGFKNRKVQTTRYKLLKQLRWPNSSTYYERLEKCLSQLVSMSVSTNAVWDKEKKTHKKVKFNVLDSFEVEDKPAAGNDTLTVIWGSKMFELFELNYLKRIDLDQYYALDNALTKKLYRYLDKHLTLRTKIEMDVVEFGHLRMGIAVPKKYPSQVLQVLEPKLETLREQRLFDFEVVKSQTPSKKKFVFTRYVGFDSVKYPQTRLIIQALADRGVDSPEQFVHNPRHSWMEIIRQIEHYEYHQKAGTMRIKDSGAWIADAIRKQHKLPKPLERKIRRVVDNTAKWCDAVYEELDEDVRAYVNSLTDVRLSELNPAMQKQQRRLVRNQILLDGAAMI